MSFLQGLSLITGFFVAVLNWAHVVAPPSETARIRQHLLGAERQLLDRDVSGLTESQRTARNRCIADLREYRERGVFPHNHEMSGARTPVFLDEHGTRCAMAHLIERSGAEELVRRVAESRNLARIRDLVGDPELVAWLDDNGMTLAEAARVQPEYDSFRVSRSQGATATGVLGATVGTVGVAVNVHIGDTQGGRNARGLTGVVLGVVGAGVGVGTYAFSDATGPRALGVFDVGLGIASFGLGLRQLNSEGPRERALSPSAWVDRDGSRRVALIARF